ncbi:hypothetical protein P3T16_001779 [Paraburkholderia sp. GAS42]
MTTPDRTGHFLGEGLTHHWKGCFGQVTGVRER